MICLFATLPCRSRSLRAQLRRVLCHREDGDVDVDPGDVTHERAEEQEDGGKNPDGKTTTPAVTQTGAAAGHHGGEAESGRRSKTTEEAHVPRNLVEIKLVRLLFFGSDDGNCIANSSFAWEMFLFF